MYNDVKAGPNPSTSTPTNDGKTTGYENIFAQIRQEKSDFLWNDINPSPGWSFNQYRTIKRIHLYSNSRFENGQYYLGKEKIFFDITSNPTELAATMLDFDTRHVKAYSNQLNSYFKMFLFNKELEFYLKKNKFSTMLNELAVDVARYGSAVVQKVGKDLKSVDLRKLIIDPSVERLDNSRFITIEHDWTPSELREIGADNKWDINKVEEAITKFGNKKSPNSYIDQDGSFNNINSTPYIKCYERWGEVPEKWLDGGKSEKMVKSCFFVAGCDSQSMGDSGKPIAEDGVILYKTKWHKAFPFKDFHYTKTKGRWLGVGVVEKLFPIQIRFNELKNQLRFAMELSSKQLYQTRDKTAYNNILTDVDNGQILHTKSELQKVPNEIRDLASFRTEEESYSKQAGELAFSYQSIQGNQGAETTATTSIANVKATSNIFDFKKENIANDLRDFFNDFIRDEVISDITPEHVLIFTGNVDQLSIFDEQYATHYANKFFVSKVINSGKFTQEDYDGYKKKILSDLKQGKIERKTLIEKGFFADAEVWLDFNISNESIDPATMFANSNSVLIALAQNPGILQDPRLKIIFYKYMESLGINPTEIEMAEQSLNSSGNGGQPSEMMMKGGVKPASPAPANPALTGTSNLPKVAAKTLAQ